MARLVLIDDDQSLLTVLTLALSDAGHVVMTAADGPAGLALVETSAPELVISDVNLPYLDGFLLARA